MDHVSLHFEVGAMILLSVADMGGGQPQVHFHIIPKPNEKEGLGVGWPAKDTDMEGLKKYFEEIKSKI